MTIDPITCQPTALTPRLFNRDHMYDDYGNVGRWAWSGHLHTPSDSTVSVIDSHQVTWPALGTAHMSLQVDGAVMRPTRYQCQRCTPSQIAWSPRGVLWYICTFLPCNQGRHFLSFASSWPIHQPASITAPSHHPRFLWPYTTTSRSCHQCKYSEVY